MERGGRVTDLKNSVVAKVWVRFFHMGKTYKVVELKKKVVE